MHIAAACLHSQAERIGDRNGGWPWKALGA